MAEERPVPPDDFGMISWGEQKNEERE